MLVAPIIGCESFVTPQRRVPKPTLHNTHRSTRAAPVFLLAWFGLGIALLLVLPALRGNALFGATLPFWLVGAPLLDLAWLWRARLARVLARMYERISRRQGTRAVSAALVAGRCRAPRSSSR